MVFKIVSRIGLLCQANLVHACFIRCGLCPSCAMRPIVETAAYLARKREVPGLAFCPCNATSHVNVSRGIASILTGRESLRDIEVYLRTQAKRRYHMGLRCETVTRNTLSNASINPWLSTMAGSSLTNVVSACLRHQNSPAQAIA